MQDAGTVLSATLSYVTIKSFFPDGLLFIYDVWTSLLWLAVQKMPLHQCKNSRSANISSRAHHQHYACRLQSRTINQGKSYSSLWSLRSGWQFLEAFLFILRGFRSFVGVSMKNIITLAHWIPGQDITRLVCNTTSDFGNLYRLSDHHVLDSTSRTTSSSPPRSKWNRYLLRYTT